MTNSTVTADVDVRERTLLNASEDAAPGEAVEVVAKQLADSVGATDVDFFIADLSGERLVPITRVSGDEGFTAADEEGAINFEGTLEGEALRQQKTQVAKTASGVQVVAPVTARGEAIGVLVLRLAHQPSKRVIATIDESAHTLAYIVIANRHHTGLYEWGQRSRPMSLAAEIQRRLIPTSFTCETGAFTLAAWLEPSSKVAGDTFDYTVGPSTLTLSMTDAMGHSIDSALLATIAVSALRNARYADNALEECASIANEALGSNSTDDQFVTGVLVDVDLESGVARMVNAGHPPPFLLRDGVATIVSPKVDLPLGMFSGVDYRVQEFEVRVGDRLILITDGLLERNAERFDFEAAVTRFADLHPREMVRQICREVTEAAGGELEDDATILCLDWHGARKERHSSSGANHTSSF